MIKTVKVTSIYLSVFVAIAFFTAGVFYGEMYQQAKLRQYLEGFRPLEVQNPLYTFISPLVGIEAPSALMIGLYSKENKRIRNLIKEYKEEGKVSEISVYFHDMNSARWFGINENKEFFPASLLKLLFALAAYKQAEDYPAFLNTQVQFTPTLYSLAEARDGTVVTKLTVGEWYTVPELVDTMLIYSDNSARDLLSTVVMEKYIDKLYFLIGINAPDPNKDYRISAADYSLFMRLLYRSTFINEDHSEHLLKVLSQSTFTEGIVSGVSSKVLVSHKFGSYAFAVPGTTTPGIEIHDCGIVYASQNPYLLCVMTKGTNQDDLIELIQKISKIVYRD